MLANALGVGQPGSDLNMRTPLAFLLENTTLLTCFFVTLAALCLLAPLEIAQVSLAVAGASAYLLLQEKASLQTRQDAASKKALLVSAGQRRGVCGKSVLRKSHQALLASIPEQNHESRAPVKSLVFGAADFDRQVDELLRTLMPSALSERVAQELAQCAQEAIQGIFPGVDVQGFASGDVVRGTAFGVAVPEVDLVATASQHELTKVLHGRLSMDDLSTARLDARKLQKSAIRACTDQLVSAGGFKFRRSAFRGQEPKVTLMSPTMSAGQAIPVDFSVNASTPACHAAMLAECALIDPRARALALLVKRWAKDRGVCQAARGHLAPYAWTLLAAYFLQVGVRGASVLPPLQGFKSASGPSMRRGDPAKVANDEESSADTRTVGSLFGEFLRFYAQEVNWATEAISVRKGQRAPADMSLAPHVLERPDGTTQVGPSIEDPFEPAKNLSTSLTSMGLLRLRQEFERGHSLMQVGAPLAELLAPWVPTERTRGSSEEGEEEEEGDDIAAPVPHAPRSLRSEAPTTMKREGWSPTTMKRECWSGHSGKAASERARRARGGEAPTEFKDFAPPPGLHKLQGGLNL